MRLPLLILSAFLASLSLNAAPALPKTAPIDPGPMRNPFIDLAGLRSSAHKASFSVTLSTDGRAHGSAWLLGRYRYYNGAPSVTLPVQRAFAYRFDDLGDVTELHDLPEEYVFNDPLGQSWIGPIANERWLVFPAHIVKNLEVVSDPVWCVADMSRRPFHVRHLPISGTPRGLAAMNLWRDSLVYTYVVNPTGSSKGAGRNLQTTGDPVYWVTRLDLTTGKETLLASSRANPPLDPVQAEKLDGFTRLMFIDGRAFMLGGKTKESAFVHDLEAASWREADDLDRLRAQEDDFRNSYNGWRTIDIDGVPWALGFNVDPERCLTVQNLLTKRRLRIPISFERSDVYRFAGYTKLLERVAKVSANTVAPLRFGRDGAAVSVGEGCYFWLPYEKIRAVVRAAPGSDSSGAGP